MDTLEGMGTIKYLLGDLSDPLVLSHLEKDAWTELPREKPPIPRLDAAHNMLQVPAVLIQPGTDLGLKL